MIHRHASKPIEKSLSFYVDLFFDLHDQDEETAINNYVLSIGYASFGTLENDLIECNLYTIISIKQRAFVIFFKN